MSVKIVIIQQHKAIIKKKTHKISVHEKVKLFCRFCIFSESLISRVKLHEQRKHAQEIKEYHEK